MPARILVIEDNPANLELMTYLLGAFGYETLAASDGGEGLAAAKRERPDLILCDIQLPALDGFAVLQELKQDSSLAAVPVVAVTAFAMVGDRERMQRAGFNGYISKPIEPAGFMRQVESFLPESLQAPQKTAESTHAPPRPRVRLTGTEACVLIVDNSPSDRELLSRLLQPSGYSVIIASDGGEALHLARDARPSLIISDVEMPYMNGFDLLRAVRLDPDLRPTPFILLSATATSPYHQLTGRQLGANRYVLRPIDPTALLAEIESVLEEVRSAARPAGR